MGAIWNRIKRGWVRSEIAAATVNSHLNEIEDERMALGERPGIPGATTLAAFDTLANGPNPMFEQAAEMDREAGEAQVAALQQKLDSIPKGSGKEETAEDGLPASE